MTASARIPTGIYRAVDFGLNWSTLKSYRVSARHGHHAETTAETDSDSPDLLIGRAVDTMTLEPDLFAERFAVWTEGDRRGGKWTAFKDEHASRDILTAAQHEQAKAMREALFGHSAARRYLEAPDRAVQVARQWVDKDTGTRCKGRFDLVPWDAEVVDLKTTRSLVLRKFQAQAWDLGWFHQGAWYRRGQAAHLGTSREFVYFTIIAVDKTAPYDVAVFPIRLDTLDDCDAEIDELLALRKRCRDSGVYPGAYPEPVEIGAPAWAVEMNDDGRGFEIIEGGAEQ